MHCASAHAHYKPIHSAQWCSYATRIRATDQYNLRSHVLHLMNQRHTFAAAGWLPVYSQQSPLPHANARTLWRTLHKATRRRMMLFDVKAHGAVCAYIHNTYGTTTAEIDDRCLAPAADAHATPTRCLLILHTQAELLCWAAAAFVRHAFQCTRARAVDRLVWRGISHWRRALARTLAML